MNHQDPATSFPKDQIKVLLLENIHPSAHELFHAEGVQLETVKTALGEDELVRRIEDVHILGIRSKTRVTERALAASRRLLSVGCFCIGTNQVDLDSARKRGIPVFNAPFSNTRSVAEMIIAEIVMLSRKLGDRVREMHAGQWRKVATGSLRSPRQNAGHRRLRPHRPAGRRDRRGARDAGGLLRRRRQASDGQQPLDEDARRAPCTERLRDAARAGDAADQEDDRRPRDRRDARGQLRAQREPRQSRRHWRARGRAQERPRRGRCNRRLPRRAGVEQRRLHDPAAGSVERRHDAAHRRVHSGGSGGDRSRGRRRALIRVRERGRDDGRR